MVATRISTFLTNLPVDHWLIVVSLGVIRLLNAYPCGKSESRLSWPLGEGGQCYCLEDKEREASNSIYIVFTFQLFHRKEIKARSCKIYCLVSLTAPADPEKLKKTSGCRLIAMLFRAPIKVLEWGAYR